MWNPVNPFVPNAPFLYPLETSENRMETFRFRNTLLYLLEKIGTSHVALIAAIFLVEVKNNFSVDRAFSGGRRPAIFADHWTTNGLKVAGHKSVTVYFFLSEIIFREKMVSLSNNDRFHDDNIFLCNIWHFSIITGINYVTIFFVFILKIHERI